MQHSTTEMVAVQDAPTPPESAWSNRPVAAPGLQSYRYAGPRGWIMMGAKDDAAALRKAQESSAITVTEARLQRWDGKAYVPVTQTTEARGAACA